MYNAYSLFNPVYAGGVTIPPWTPGSADTDLLQYWYDLVDPAIINPEVLSYRSIIDWSGGYHPTAGSIASPAPIPDLPGNLRPYQPGRSYLGDGAAYADCGSDPSLDITDEITISGWVSFEGGQGTVVAGNIANLDNGYWIGWYALAERLFFKLDGVADLLIDNVIPISTLCYFTCTWDGAEMISYINGIEVGRINATGSITNWVGTILGRANAGYNFDGTMRDVRIYNVGSTPEQVTALYENDYANMPPIANLMGFWKCDEGSGDISYDSSGNENHGSILNNYVGFHSLQNEYSFQNEVGYSPGTVMGPVVDHTGTWDGTRVGSEYVIPGVGDWTYAMEFEITTGEYFTIPNALMKTLTTNHSYSFWIKPTVLQSGVRLLDDNVAGGELIAYTSGLYYSTGGFVAQSPAITPLDAWHHIVCTMESSSLKVYVDKVVTSATGPATYGAPFSSDKYVGVLPGQPTNAAYQYQGLMSDIRVYDKTLTQGEVDTLFDTPTDMSISGLIAHYNFDEGPTGVVADPPFYIPRNELIPAEDVLGNPLQYFGRAQGYGVLKNLPCGSFDGVGSEVEVADSPTLQNQDFTVGVWIKTSDSTNKWRRLAMKLDITTNQTWSISIPTDAYGVDVIHFRSDDLSDSGVVQGTTNVVTGDWVYVCLSKSGSTITLYVNGVQDAQEVRTGTLVYSTLSMFIGDNNSGIQAFEGEMFDFRIYSYGISALEAAALATGDSTDPNYPPNTNLALHLPFSENGGTIVHDVSGNDNHGNWLNYNIANIWGTQDEYAYNQENGFNRRLWFNGVDSYVDCGDNAAYKFTGAFSISLWVYADTVPFNGLVCKDNASTTRSYRVYLLEGGRVVFNIWISEAAQQINSVASIPDKTWTHLTVVNDLTDIIIYIGGTEDNSGAWGGAVDDTIAPLQLGTMPNETNILDGIMDDIRLYDYALTPLQVAALATGDESDPNWPSDTNLVAHWPLNDINPPALTRSRVYVNASDQYHLGGAYTAPEQMWASAWVYTTINNQAKRFALIGNLLIDHTASTEFQVRRLYSEGHIGLLTPGTINKWYCLASFTDATTLYLFLDGVLKDTIPHTYGTPVTNELGLASYGGASVSSLDGNLSQVYFGLDCTTKTPQEIASTLYNNGLGLHPLQITDQQKSDWDVQSAWALDESAGDAFDSVGSNHMTQYNDPVSGIGFRDVLVEDIAGGNTGTLVGGYNWLDQPVASDPEMPAGKIFLPALGDQIDWVDYPNSGTDLPWAKRSNYIPENEYGPDKVVNGGFADYTGTQDDGVGDTFTGWLSTPRGGLVEATADSELFGNAAKLSFPDGGGSSPYLRQTLIVLKPYTDYILRLRVKQDTGANFGVYLGGENDVIFSYISPAGVTDEYTYIDLPFNTLDNTTFTTQLYNLAENTPPKYVYLDNVLIKEVFPQVIVNWPASYMYGDPTNGRHIVTNDQFTKRTYNQGISKFLNYREALTGDDLTEAKAYTEDVVPIAFSRGFSKGFE